MLVVFSSYKIYFLYFVLSILHQLEIYLVEQSQVTLKPNEEEVTGIEWNF